MQCDILEWILEEKKDISGKTGSLTKVWFLVNNSNISLLVLTNVPCKMLTLG